MKHILLILLSTFTLTITQAQSGLSRRSEPGKIALSYDGLYVAKTITVATGADSMVIYNYIRFYSDGTVYTQAVNGYAPADVAKWLGKKGRFERKGTYTIKEGRIDFTVNNSESKDLPLEGPMTDAYAGKSAANNSLDLQVKYNDGNTQKYRFEYVKTD